MSSYASICALLAATASAASYSKNYYYSSPSYYDYSSYYVIGSAEATGLITAVYLINLIVPIVVMGLWFICLMVGWCCCCKVKRIDANIKEKRSQAKKKLREKITRLEQQGGLLNHTDVGTTAVVDFENGLNYKK